MTLGQKIRTERNKKGISMEVLAMAAGIGRSTIYKIEKGLIKHSSLHTIQRICDVLKISLNEVTK